MDKLIFHSSRQQCLITFSFDTILRRLMRFSTHCWFSPGRTREREREREGRDEREKFSRAIKHYRTSRVRLIKSAASTTAAHREERNHYQGKKGFAIELYSFRGETNGTWKTKKKKNGRGKRYLAAWKQEWKWEERGELIEKNGKR